MTVASAAVEWQQHGFSTIPIAPTHAKRPAVRWTEFMARVPTMGEVDEWWGNGREHGLALIMGKVSGGAEMLELEARACDADSLIKIDEACIRNGVRHVWDLLQSAQGYSEQSPYGGLHFIYRITDREVPGNQKVARRPATEDELESNPDDRIKVLSETRGEGGYVIVAPTSGLCHPSGESWVLVQGEAGLVPGITWEERCALIDSVREALDQPLRDPVVHETALSLVGQPGSAQSGVDAGTSGRPGDDFEARIDWDDQLLLGGAGWRRVSSSGQSATWVRPGKDARDGISATTGRDANRDRLFVFSTSTVFPTDTPVTKFGAYAILNHNGDHRAAAIALRKLGFGSVDTGSREIPDFVPGGNIEQESCNSFTLDDMGSSQRLADYVGGRYVWVHEEGIYYRWTGRIWTPDHNRVLVREWMDLTAGLLESEDSAEAKWASRARGAHHTAAAVKHMASVPGHSMSKAEFNQDRGMLNLQNGVYNLNTGEFGPHQMSLRFTRLFGASFIPEATCPNFITFMREVIPHDEVRAYVQRSLGYTLLGDANQRALFLVWGPSGTGKSQFMETVQHVFGDYGATASIGAFMAKRDGQHSADIHRLRGKRFVSTSETADDTRFDEEVVKRLTGCDTISTRTLYQKEQEWKPECTIWIATNHKPKFNSDDDAIWRRSKLMPFVTRFGSDDSPDEITDYARRFLFGEADGIFNWMLEGLRDYLEFGLGEPEEIKEQATQHRREVDTVAIFLEEAVSDGRLELNPLSRIKTFELHNMYMDWCRQSSERPLGRRRFVLRTQSNLPDVTWVKVGNQAGLQGIGRGDRVMAMPGGLFAPSER